MTEEQKAVVAELLNRLPFVTWDRCVEYAGAENVDADDLSVFGWIVRDDGRSDFVELVWPDLSETDCGFSTSNAERSHEIAVLLFGGHEGHLDCQRVEHIFGDLVTQKVVLGTEKARPERYVTFFPWGDYTPSEGFICYGPFGREAAKAHARTLSTDPDEGKVARLVLP